MPKLERHLSQGGLKVDHYRLRLDARERNSTSNGMVVVIACRLHFEYVRDPRHALEPDNAEAA
jgi:hypothetical protein